MTLKKQGSTQYLEMHSDILIKKDAYCGSYMTHLIMEAGGVHEPEEEYFFGQILSSLPDDASILELGSYWAYYSAWFLKHCGKGKSVCLDNSLNNLQIGKETYEINNLSDRGTFLHGFAGDELQENERIYTVDFLIETYFPKGLSILHSDIQGHELSMLKGAENALNKKQIAYLFISTHSEELHKFCINFLEQKKYSILKSIDITESSSFDGLILASSNDRY